MLHAIVHREKALRLARRLELSHLSLPAARSFVGDFRSVVLISSCAMRHAGHIVAFYSPIVGQLVGGESVRAGALRAKVCTPHANCFVSDRHAALSE